MAVQVSSSGVSFQGALSFVQTLADYLAFDGSGLTVDTAGSAITITLTLAIPSIGVGVFSLQNLAFSAGCSIPYDGDPVRFNFAFCSRENPFQLTIMMFGGGGFVALSIGVDGVEVLELGFDFGAGISLDLGVASGQSRSWAASISRCRPRTTPTRLTPRTSTSPPTSRPVAASPPWASYPYRWSCTWPSATSRTAATRACPVRPR